MAEKREREEDILVVERDALKMVNEKEYEGVDEHQLHRRKARVKNKEKLAKRN